MVLNEHADQSEKESLVDLYLVDGTKQALERTQGRSQTRACEQTDGNHSAGNGANGTPQERMERMHCFLDNALLVKKPSSYEGM